MLHCSLLLSLYFLLGISYKSFAQSSKNTQAFALNLDAKISHAYQLLKENPSLAYREGNNILNQAKENSYPQGAIEALILLATHARQVGKADEALQYYEVALKKYTQYLSTSLHADVLHGLGMVHYDRQNLANALQYFFEALKLKKNMQDDEIKATILNSIGNVYYQQKECKNALYYYQETLKIFEKLNPKKDISGLLSDIGNTFYCGEDYNQALQYYYKGLDNAKQNKNEISFGFLFHNIGLVFEKQNNPKEALVYFQKGLWQRRKVQNRIGVLNSLVSLADFYQRQGETNLQRSIAIEALDLARELRHIECAQSAANHLYLLYNKEMNFEQALRYQVLASKYKDTLQTQSYGREINTLKIRLETEKKETENIALKKQYALQQQAVIFTLAAFGLTLFACVLLFLRYKTNAKLLEQEKQKTQLLHTQTALEQAIQATQKKQMEEEIAARYRELTLMALHLIEKNDLLREVRSRLSKIKDDSTKDVLRDIQAHLNAENDWENFKIHFLKVNPTFFDNLKGKELNDTELKYAAYLRINLNNKEIARIAGISEQAVKMTGNRLKKKLGLEAEESLRNFLNAL